ncbi:MAG: flagellar filament capping protein FliD [Bdellovibrionales bacterium]|nr:flagellar filament capping protein FliD [Bdellovibrionales bacterium]
MAPLSVERLSGVSPELQTAFEKMAEGEAKQLKAVETQQHRYDKKVELLTDIVNRVNGVSELIPGLRTADSIRDPSVSSSHENVLIGTADDRLARFGSHNIEVLQLAAPATAISNGFPDKDETRIGSGYFSYETVDGETREVFVDDGEATLEGLANIINSANMGVRASVINDSRDLDLPWRLVLTHDGSGKPNSVDYPVFYFVDGEEEIYLAEESPARNAKLLYEGMEVESPTNDVAGLIPGVTVNLRGLSDAGKPSKLTISQDIDATKLKMKDFVDRVNSVFQFVNDQNKAEPDQARNTLAGDYGIRLTKNRMVRALQDGLFLDGGGKVRVLSDLGIEFTKQGTLKYDEKKFENALNESFDEVVALLTGDGESTGVITRLESALTGITGRDSGVLSIQKKNAEERVRRAKETFQKREVRAQKRIDLMKDRISRAQQAITDLRNQSSRIGQLSGGGGVIPGL